MTNDITNSNKQSPICPHCGAGERFLKRQELAKLLNVNPKTLANWASAGIEPKPVYFANRLLRYRKSDWMKEAGYWQAPAVPTSTSEGTGHVADTPPASSTVAGEGAR